MPFDVGAGGEPVTNPFGRLRRIAVTLGGLAGWRRWLAGLLLGLISAAAMPPLNLVPILWLGFPGLVWLIDGARSRRQAAGDGWRFAFGFFVPVLYWTTLSLFVDIGQFWMLVPAALFGLPAFLALGPAVAAAIARSIPAGGSRRILVFVATMSALDWGRGHFPFGGFPWAMMGYAWSADAAPLLAVTQSTALFGIYGLTLVTLLVACLPARLGQPGTRGQQLCAPAIGILLLASLAISGGLRLASGPDPLIEGARLRIVQTDNPQLAEWSPQVAAEDAARLLALAVLPGGHQVAAQIWPEAAIDFFINRDADVRAAVGRAAPSGGVAIFGTMRAGDQGDEAWNSVGVVDAAGRLLSTYDKVHLVPFGEYVPLRSILRFSQIVTQRLDFATGPGPRTLVLPNLPPVSPIICYEAIFPHAVVDETNRPGWIVNVTNDAWFGTSIGPRQHFAITRVRAVEEGLPLVRAGNSGISAIIDPHGRVLSRLDLGQRGILDGVLPQALPRATPYARHGDALYAAMLLALLIAARLGFRRF